MLTTACVHTQQNHETSCTSKPQNQLQKSTYCKTSGNPTCSVTSITPCIGSFYSCTSQARSFTPQCRRGWAWPRLLPTATLWVLSWLPLDSSTWPGKQAWTSVTPAGWLMAASAIPSMSRGRTAVETNPGCGQSTTTPTAPASQTPQPCLMPIATKVLLAL